MISKAVLLALRMFASGRYEEEMTYPDASPVRLPSPSRSGGRAQRRGGRQARPLTSRLHSLLPHGHPDRLSNTGGVTWCPLRITRLSQGNLLPAEAA